MFQVLSIDIDREWELIWESHTPTPHECGIIIIVMLL